MNQLKKTILFSTCLILGLGSPILSMNTGEGSKNYPGPTQTFRLSDRRLNQEACRALVNRPVSEIVLEGCHLGDPEARILAQAAHLRELNLVDNEIGPEGAEAIATGNLTALTSLNLGSNDIGVRGARAISGANFVGLTFLNLEDNGIGDEGATAIASRLTNLVSLNLEDNGIGDEGAMALYNTPFPRLTFLNLTFNRIGNEVKYSFKKNKPIEKLLL